MLVVYLSTIGENKQKEISSYGYTKITGAI